jgi:di/tricarboxylate transporter
MNASALFTLVLILFISILLVSERLRSDLVALILLVILGLSGIIPQKDIFTGFSSTAVMTILGISIISEGLRQTGVSHWLSKIMFRFGQRSEGRLILAVMLASACLSLFMNNIAAVGVLLPAVMTLARQAQVAPARLLMPLAYGTTLGGMATLLTTSNIIVSSTLRDAGFIPFGLLDFLPIGIPILVIGIIYMLLIGRLVLTSETRTRINQPLHQMRTELQKIYDLNKNLHLMLVLPDCPFAGQTISGGNWAAQTGLSIIGVLRDQQVNLAPHVEEIIRPGDHLLVQGNPKETLLSDLGLQFIEIPGSNLSVANETTLLAELVITPRASLVGKTLAEIHFREKFNLNVLGIWRNNQAIQVGLGLIKLNSGDALLVQGTASAIQLLRDEPDLVLIKEDPDAVLNPKKYVPALLITFITLGVASLGILPVAPVILAGAAMILLTRCLNMNDVYRTVEWRAIFLIAGMWPLSIAIRTTGLADFLIQNINLQTGHLPFIAISALLLLLAFLVSQLMGGQVAPLVLAPLAISAALSAGLDPRGLAMAVALGCSLTFPTPYGHPVNLMVMSSGGYVFKDYVKVGFPLTILVFISILGGLIIFWN